MTRKKRIKYSGMTSITGKMNVILWLKKTSWRELVWKKYYNDSRHSNKFKQTLLQAAKAEKLKL